MILIKPFLINIHARITGQPRRGGPILTTFYHFQPLHEQLHINWTITAERSPLHLAMKNFQLSKKQIVHLHYISLHLH